MKKRLWFLAFVLIFMLCFTACGKEEEPQPLTDVPEEEIQDTDEEDETEDVDSEDGSDEALAVRTVNRQVRILRNRTQVQPVLPFFIVMLTRPVLTPRRCRLLPYHRRKC